ncbi:hypothetical protein FOXB_02264 [Fusarium oxysporum f. sp. conglutinans Fo5176]|uniref:Uncharacterized protein n=1 Tax=Fusarium oxysporum (strain Fo5176) TaxID=660025 RepID=F9F789_FUSOF|nr:hypothetical protein FOXB_02264 [Fusarium oxysporum f. sp. conglutinans Fo5176]
MTKLSGLTP